MRISCALLLIAIPASGWLANSLHADRGVFNAAANPPELVIETPTAIKVTAEIGTGPVIVSSVQVYQTDANGKPLALLSRLYDDGTHGDAVQADTIFSADVNPTMSRAGTIYLRVTAAYQKERDRYLSPVIPVTYYNAISQTELDSNAAKLQAVSQSFESALNSGRSLAEARQQALASVQSDPTVASAVLSADEMFVTFRSGLQGLIYLSAPGALRDSVPATAAALTLPANYKSPGNANLLIFAPGYSDPSPQTGVADSAQSRFSAATHMTFSPKPAVITKDSAAGLDVVSQWGTYGTVVMHTHGGFDTAKQSVILLTGTQASLVNRVRYLIDIITGRVGITSGGKFYIYPTYITAHCGPMQNTFFYLGACESLKNDSVWNALKAKGAKVAFGWSETVLRTFNTSTFTTLITPMLPTNADTTPLTAKQAFDAVPNKSSPDTPPAVLQMRTASAEWNDFMFYPGGIINGDFETGDLTGWTHGGSFDQYTKAVSSQKHGGTSSAAIGRWDAAFTGVANPTLEPNGFSFLYQDVVVPSSVQFLTFDWWGEGYDTARWDWFDALIMNTSGTTLKTIVSQAGKPGSDFGPYWTTGTLVPSAASGSAGTAVGGGWYEIKTDISAYRGQTIRIYFRCALDGYGDQTRYYIDDVRFQ